jgi:hypothetical protein
MQTASFEITGDFITSYLRDEVLGDWRHAVRTISEAIPDLPVAAIGEVMVGTKKLVGRNDLTLEDDSDESQREEIEDKYGCVFEQGGRFYEPYALVTQLGHEDLWTANRIIGRDVEDHKVGCLPSYLRERWYLERAKYYADNKEDIAVAERGQFGQMTGRYVLFMPCQDPPFFVRANRDPKKAVTLALEGGRYLDQRRCQEAPARPEPAESDPAPVRDARAEEAAEAQDWDRERERLRTEILTQAEQAGGFMGIYAAGEWLRIPHFAFMRWCLQDRRDLWENFPWVPVCESGLKLHADNQYHSDVIIGAGLDLPDAYDRAEGCFAEASWEVRFDVCRTFDSGMEVLDVRG